MPSVGEDAQKRMSRTISRAYCGDTVKFSSAPAGPGHSTRVPSQAKILQSNGQNSPPDTDSCNPALSTFLPFLQTPHTFIKKPRLCHGIRFVAEHSCVQTSTRLQCTHCAYSCREVASLVLMNRARVGEALVMGLQGGKRVNGGKSSSLRLSTRRV